MSESTEERIIERMIKDVNYITTFKEVEVYERKSGKVERKGELKYEDDWRFGIIKLKYEYKKRYTPSISWYPKTLYSYRKIKKVK